MVNLGVFILTWTVFSLFGDFKRIPELLPTAIFAGFLALLTDIIMVNYELWSYSDLLISDEGVKLLLGFGLYFVVSYLYIQYIPSELKKILLYTFCWSLFAIAIEISYLNFEIMDHHKWWKLWTSYTADWLIFGLIYVQHRYYTQVKFR